MDWWQVFLIIVLFIIAGLGIGYMAGYLIVTRILKKPFLVVLPGKNNASMGSGQAYRANGTGMSTVFSKIAGAIKPKTEKKADTDTQKDIPNIEPAKETPATATLDYSAELAQEKDRKRIEQQTREIIQREAEEARRARIIQEREKKKAEQIAREIAQKEAEAAKKARELEEKQRKETEQQARESAQREIEAARKASELEERARRETEQKAKEAALRQAEAAGKAGETSKEEPLKAAAGGEYSKFDTPGLLAEVENNRMLANEPWTGKLIPFQTYVWNTNPNELHTLPAGLREDMAQAYSDIQLANSIVWLATELGRRSPSLDENYMKLCTNIAARLETIEPILKQAINK